MLDIVKVIDDEEDLKAKYEAMCAYEFERRPCPHPRSSETLKIFSSFRGMTIGAQYAEAFQIIPKII